MEFIVAAQSYKGFLRSSTPRPKLQSHNLCSQCQSRLCATANVGSQTESVLDVSRTDYLGDDVAGGTTEGCYFETEVNLSQEHPPRRYSPVQDVEYQFSYDEGTFPGTYEGDTEIHDDNSGTKLEHVQYFTRCPMCNCDLTDSNLTANMDKRDSDISNNDVTITDFNQDLVMDTENNCDVTSIDDDHNIGTEINYDVTSADVDMEIDTGLLSPQSEASVYFLAESDLIPESLTPHSSDSDTSLRFVTPEPEQDSDEVVTETVNVPDDGDIQKTIGKAITTGSVLSTMSTDVDLVSTIDEPILEEPSQELATVENVCLKLMEESTAELSDVHKTTENVVESDLQAGDQQASSTEITTGQVLSDAVTITREPDGATNVQVVPNEEAAASEGVADVLEIQETIPETASDETPPENELKIQDQETIATESSLTLENIDEVFEHQQSSVARELQEESPVSRQLPNWISSPLSTDLRSLRESVTFKRPEPLRADHSIGNEYADLPPRLTTDSLSRYSRRRLRSTEDVFRFDQSPESSKFQRLFSKRRGSIERDKVRRGSQERDFSPISTFKSEGSVHRRFTSDPNIFASLMYTRQTVGDGGGGGGTVVDDKSISYVPDDYKPVTARPRIAVSEETHFEPETIGDLNEYEVHSAQVTDNVETLHKEAEFNLYSEFPANPKFSKELTELVVDILESHTVHRADDNVPEMETESGSGDIKIEVEVCQTKNDLSNLLRENRGFEEDTATEHSDKLAEESEAISMDNIIISVESQTVSGLTKADGISHVEICGEVSEISETEEPAEAREIQTETSGRMEVCDEVSKIFETEETAEAHEIQTETSGHVEVCEEEVSEKFETKTEEPADASEIQTETSGFVESITTEASNREEIESEETEIISVPVTSEKSSQVKSEIIQPTKNENESAYEVADEVQIEGYDDIMDSGISTVDESESRFGESLASSEYDLKFDKEEKGAGNVYTDVTIETQTDEISSTVSEASEEPNTLSLVTVSTDETYDSDESVSTVVDEEQSLTGSKIVEVADVEEVQVEIRSESEGEALEGDDSDFSDNLRPRCDSLTLVDVPRIGETFSVDETRSASVVSSEPERNKQFALISKETKVENQGVQLTDRATSPHDFEDIPLTATRDSLTVFEAGTQTDHVEEISRSDELVRDEESRVSPTPSLLIDVYSQTDVKTDDAATMTSNSSETVSSEISEDSQMDVKVDASTQFEETEFESISHQAVVSECDVPIRGTFELYTLKPAVSSQAVFETQAKITDVTTHQMLYTCSPETDSVETEESPLNDLETSIGSIDVDAIIDEVSDKIKGPSLVIIDTDSDWTPVRIEVSTQTVPHHDDDLNSTSRNIEVRQLGTSQLDDSTNQIDLDVSYQNACEQIQKLELQLSKRGEYEDLNASRRIADTEQELDDLKHLNNELNRKIKEQGLKIKSHEQEKSLAKERSTTLQQEVNRLRQEYLTLKEGLNSEQQNTAKYVDQINALQKELDKSRRDSDELRDLVHQEQEKAHILEREKDAMTWNAKRLQSERDGITEERYGLEEKIIGLETLMAQLKDECNTLRVKHADQQAEIYRHETESDKLKKAIQSKDEVIQKYKELVQDNQNAAEKLREECQQLNDEFEEKNNTVSQLHSKLKRLQQTYNIPSADLALEAGDLDFIPKGAGNQSARGSARKSSAQNESGAAHSRSEESQLNGRAANGSGLRIDLSQLADSTSQEENERLQHENYILKGQLQAEKDLVESLKSEIKLQESLKKSREKSAKSTQNGEGDLRLREHLEELRKLRLQLEESIEKNSKLEDLLTRQLTQLGVDGDTINQYIKSQLDQSNAANAKGEKQTTRLLQQLDEVKREMDLLEQEVHGKDKEIEILNRELKKKDAIFKELEERIRTKDETLQMMTIESESKATQLIATTAEAKRLKDEINRLRDALGENEELNKTLKLELSVYDKMANDSKTQALDPQSLDLNMLLEEIRQLRIQMVKTIENNNKLRRTLEENLAKNRSPLHSMMNGEISREEMRGGFNETETPRRSSVRFARKDHDYEHGNHAFSPIATVDSGLATYDDLLDDHREGSYGDPLYGILGETYIDRYFARKGRKQGLRASSLSRSHTVTGRDLSPPTKLSERSQSTEGRYLTPRRNAEDTGPLHAHELTNGKAADPKHRLFNGTSQSAHSPRTKRLMESLQGSARDNWRYDITDPLRPPKYPSMTKALEDSQSSGSTSQRVGADVRMLYAIGELDDYELLKKEIAESQFIINGIEVRIKERLRSHKHSSQTDSLDYHTYRELSSSLDQLKSLNGEANRLIAMFWLSQLPVRDEFGNFIDVKLMKENQALADELAKYKKEYGRIKHKLHDASRKMEKTSRLRDSVQLDIMKQLKLVHKDQQQTGQNLINSLKRDDVLDNKP